MNRWLVKSDPEEYSAHDLEREKRTTWTGVSNPVALKHLRSMADGDEVLVYHTGQQRAIVAFATVAGKPRTDPADKSGRSVLVELEFKRWLNKPVELVQIKDEAVFADFDLVRISRLSVMPVGAAHWKRVMALAQERQRSD
jgi:predicted RNA-binding protein with PUA-like domain